MKIYLDMVGCRLNQSELEEMARQFAAAGHDLTGDMADADLAVVNTCTVTVAAAADSRKIIRRIARSGVEQIVATGCWVTMEPDQARSLAGVTQVVDNVDKSNLVASVLSLPEVDLAPDNFERIPGSRERTRAFIKTQDGCSHHCAFCVTTIARGCSISTPEKVIIDQIKQAEDAGIKEAVLTGVQLGSWGKEFPQSQHLADLVEQILKQTNIPRLRLSSIEPWDVNPALIDLVNEDRVARHLHLPLQSGSKDTLRRMARAITPKRYADLLGMIRRRVPDIALTTDLIAGFPGESDQEFQESLDFVREMEFAGGHVFTYSAREGTPAADLSDQVPHPIRKERNAQMRKEIRRSELAYQKDFLCRKLEALWESALETDPGHWHARGITDNYLRVSAEADQDLWNRITAVRLIKIEDSMIVGEVVPEN
jgi:threonylcarbamoyladenosine tRNA methylthiotransferase MtaB